MFSQLIFITSCVYIRRNQHLEEIGKVSFLPWPLPRIWCCWTFPYILDCIILHFPNDIPICQTIRSQSFFWAIYSVHSLHVNVIRMSLTLSPLLHILSVNYQTPMTHFHCMLMIPKSLFLPRSLSCASCWDTVSILTSKCWNLNTRSSKNPYFLLCSLFQWLTTPTS